jgi:hypothetical protein
MTNRRSRERERDRRLRDDLESDDMLNLSITDIQANKFKYRETSPQIKMIEHKRDVSNGTNMNQGDRTSAKSSAMSRKVERRQKASCDPIRLFASLF